MQVQTVLTLEELVAQETGDLHLRIVQLRVIVEAQKAEIATLKMQIAQAAESPS